MRVRHSVGSLTVALLLLSACQSAATRTDLRGPEIPYRSAITLKVGESANIHGMRARCGETRPPSWRRFRDSRHYFESSLGTFSDGGIGWRESVRCHGRVPARLIRFTATTPGSRTMWLFGNPIRIRVIEE